VYYPIFLQLERVPVVVVGAGRVALRKVRGLVEAGAVVTVVSPEGEPEFAELPVKWVKRAFQAEDLSGARLVFAATNDREVNRAIRDEAESLGIWVNVADSLEECGFIVPSRAQRGDVQVAVSTSGKSPRLAVRLRQKIEAMLEEDGIE
jgi:precorrin-2 dehydrogenase/sirohydrochlorin ferrochelatase